jgi:hypothetical protein
VHLPFASTPQQVAAITPFHIFNIWTYSAILYGLAGLRLGAAPFAQFAFISLMMWTIATQVRVCLCLRVCMCLGRGRPQDMTSTRSHCGTSASMRASP